MTFIAAGDTCWTPGRKKHYGVCTGYGSDGQPWFVHNMPGAGVVETGRQGFAGDQPIHIAQRPRSEDVAAVIARARFLKGRPYSLFTFNCEHAASWASSGRAESKQLQQSIAVTTLLAFVAVVANENGTSVDTDGYRRSADGRFAARRWW